MKTLTVQKTALTGNYAVAYATKMAKPHVIAAYPITPQTSIVEKLAEFVEKGELNASFVNVESEFAAMSVVYGAAMAGARAFTATSSHGLLYMYEATWWTALSRAPVDGFVLSHSTEPVEIPPQEVVDKYLPPRRPDVPMLLRPGEPVTFGNLPSDNKIHARHKVAAVYEAQQEAKKVISQADEEYGRLTGRRYGGLVEWYRAGDAKHIVVCAGAWCSDAKHAVDSLRARGVPVGLMRIRFVRPFPREEVAKLDQYETAVVYDRDITPVGGILGLEVKAALSRARVVNIVAGIAGVDFDSRHFYETIQNAIDGGYRDLVFVV